MHKIIYENNLFKFELIAQCEPTKNGINGVTQIDNGQFIVSTRDQHLFLFSKYIINKNFQQLKEITKNWPMEALQPFEIKKNIIGVYWHFDDSSQEDSEIENEVLELNHANDGLFIYEIKNDEMHQLKIIKKEPNNYYSFIYLKNSIIMEYYINCERKIFILDKNNLQIINNLTFTDDYSLSWNISAFNNSYFILAIWKKDKPIKFQIYEIKTLKKVYEWESDKKYFSNDNIEDIWDYSLSKLNNNDYLLKNLIIKIEMNK